LRPFTRLKKGQPKKKIGLLLKLNGVGQFSKNNQKKEALAQREEDEKKYLCYVFLK